MKQYIARRHFKDREKSCDGVCAYCGQWSPEKAEPDAENYYCSYCENRSLLGLRCALKRGFIHLIEDEDYDRLMVFLTMPKYHELTPEESKRHRDAISSFVKEKS